MFKAVANVSQPNQMCFDFRRFDVSQSGLTSPAMERFEGATDVTQRSA